MASRVEACANSLVHACVGPRAGCATGQAQGRAGEQGVPANGVVDHSTQGTTLRVACVFLLPMANATMPTRTYAGRDARTSLARALERWLADVDRRQCHRWPRDCVCYRLLPRLGPRPHNGTYAPPLCRAARAIYGRARKFCCCCSRCECWRRYSRTSLSCRR